MKMSDYSFIKDFSKITIKDICKKLGISQSNISAGCSSDENYKKVKNEIIKELLELIVEDSKEDIIVLYLYNEIIEKLEKENKMLREMI